jgi:hypothetical protein
MDAWKSVRIEAFGLLRSHKITTWGWRNLFKLRIVAREFSKLRSWRWLSYFSLIWGVKNPRGKNLRSSFCKAVKFGLSQMVLEKFKKSGEVKHRKA